MDVIHIPFYNEEECAHIMEQLQGLTYNTDEESKVRVHSKWVNIPRKQVAFADEDTKPYRFAGTKVSGKEWPDFLVEIRDKLHEYLLANKSISEEFEQMELNYVLVNKYKDGKDYIGYHHDDERDLQFPVVVSLSFGATRDFLLKHVETKKVESLALKNGDLLIMYGNTNRMYKHSLPKRLRVHEERINLTFRAMSEMI